MYWKIRFLQNLNVITGNSIMLLSYLVKVNNGFRMNADKLQARPVALEELCKQPEKDRPHLLVLEHTHTNTTHQTAMPQMQLVVS